MTVIFTFNVGDYVITPFGDEGIITMAAVDREGRTYYVQTKDTQQWFWEDLLKSKE